MLLCIDNGIIANSFQTPNVPSVFTVLFTVLWQSRQSIKKKQGTLCQIVARQPFYYSSHMAICLSIIHPVTALKSQGEPKEIWLQTRHAGITHQILAESRLVLYLQKSGSPFSNVVSNRTICIPLIPQGLHVSLTALFFTCTINSSSLNYTTDPCFSNRIKQSPNKIEVLLPCRESCSVTLLAIYL